MYVQRVPYRDRPLCFFDLETTGLEPGYHEVTELGFIHEKLGALCVRVMPRHLDRAQPEALQISRFKPDDWAGEPHLDKALPTIVKFMSDTILVGHNITGFDLPFLRADIEARKFNTDFIPRACIDTQVLAASHLVKRGLNGLSLNACCKYFGISNDGAHNAYDDTMRTKLLYEALMNCLKWIGQEPQQDLF
jgi:DNA polymerase-3 subunit epsilon